MALFASLAAGQQIQVGSIEGPLVQAGFEQIAQGISGMQGAAQQARAKFVDKAGNVYDAVRDATGRATNMVRNRVGEVFDVTMMAGSWIYDSVASYPEKARQSGQEAVDSLRAAAAEVVGSGGEIMRAAKEAIPEFPSRGQMMDRNQWISKMALNRMYADRFFDTVDEELESLTAGLEARYCQPPMLLPSIKRPYGEFRYPGGFKISLHTTECEVTGASHLDGTDFVCTKPRLELTKYPARYRSKYHTPVKFKSKECKFEVSHGDPDEIVLAVFDGKEDVSVENIFSRVEYAMLEAFDEDSEDAGLQEFYRLLPELGDVEADTVQLILNAMPDAAQIGQMAMNNPF